MEGLVPLWVVRDRKVSSLYAVAWPFSIWLFSNLKYRFAHQRLFDTYARLFLATQSAIRLWCATGADEFLQYTRRYGEGPTKIQSRLGENLLFQSVEVCGTSSSDLISDLLSLDFREWIEKRSCLWPRVSAIQKMNVGIHLVTEMFINRSTIPVYSISLSSKEKNTCFSVTLIIWAPRSISVSDENHSWSVAHPSNV